MTLSNDLRMIGLQLNRSKALLNARKPDGSDNLSKIIKLINEIPEDPLIITAAVNEHFYEIKRAGN